METELDRELQKAAEHTFAELCSLSVSNESAFAPLPFFMNTRVQVPFSGPRQGSLIIQGTDPLLTAIASAMLMDEPNPTEDQKVNSLREIANIICGNVVSALSNADQPFRIGSPEKIDLHGPIPDGRAAHAKIDLAQGQTEIFLFVDPQ